MPVLNGKRFVKTVVLGVGSAGKNILQNLDNFWYNAFGNNEDDLIYLLNIETDNNNRITPGDARTSSMINQFFVSGGNQTFANFAKLLYNHGFDISQTLNTANHPFRKEISWCNEINWVTVLGHANDDGAGGIRVGGRLLLHKRDNRGTSSALKLIQEDYAGQRQIPFRTRNQWMRDNLNDQKKLISLLKAFNFNDNTNTNDGGIGTINDELGIKNQPSVENCVILDNNVNVIITGSLTGGTCSGMFLDIAYIFKHIFNIPDNAISNRIKVFLTIPYSDPNKIKDNDANKPQVYANTFGALYETNLLNYEYLDTNDGPNPKPPKAIGKVYIAAPEYNNSQLNISKEGLEKMIALKMFSNILALGGDFDAALVDPSVQRKAYYYTFGCGAVLYPKSELAQLIANIFLRDFYSRLTSKNDFDKHKKNNEQKITDWNYYFAEVADTPAEIKNLDLSKALKETKREVDKTIKIIIKNYLNLNDNIIAEEIQRLEKEFSSGVLKNEIENSFELTTGVFNNRVSQDNVNTENELNKLINNVIQNSLNNYLNIECSKEILKILKVSINKQINLLITQLNDEFTEQDKLDKEQGKLNVDNLKLSPKLRAKIAELKKQAKEKKYDSTNVFKSALIEIYAEFSYLNLVKILVEKSALRIETLSNGLNQLSNKLSELHKTSIERVKVLYLNLEPSLDYAPIQYVFRNGLHEDIQLIINKIRNRAGFNTIKNQKSKLQNPTDTIGSDFFTLIDWQVLRQSGIKIDDIVDQVSRNQIAFPHNEVNLKNEIFGVINEFLSDRDDQGQIFDIGKKIAQDPIARAIATSVFVERSSKSFLDGEIEAVPNAHFMLSGSPVTTENNDFVNGELNVLFPNAANRPAPRSHYLFNSMYIHSRDYLINQLSDLKIYKEMREKFKQKPNNYGLENSIWTMLRLTYDRHSLQDTNGHNIRDVRYKIVDTKRYKAVINILRFFDLFWFSGQTQFQVNNNNQIQIISANLSPNLNFISVGAGIRNNKKIIVIQNPQNEFYEIIPIILRPNVNIRTVNNALEAAAQPNEALTLHYEGYSDYEIVDEFITNKFLKENLLYTGLVSFFRNIYINPVNRLQVDGFIQSLHADLNAKGVPYTDAIPDFFAQNFVIGNGYNQLAADSIIKYLATNPLEDL